MEDQEPLIKPIDSSDSEQYKIQIENVRGVLEELKKNEKVIFDIFRGIMSRSGLGDEDIEERLARVDFDKVVLTTKKKSGSDSSAFFRYIIKAYTGEYQTDVGINLDAEIYKEQTRIYIASTLFHEILHTLSLYSFGTGFKENQSDDFLFLNESVTELVAMAVTIAYLNQIGLNEKFSDSISVYILEKDIFFRLAQALSVYIGVDVADCIRAFIRGYFNPKEFQDFIEHLADDLDDLEEGLSKDNKGVADRDRRGEFLGILSSFFILSMKGEYETYNDDKYKKIREDFTEGKDEILAKLEQMEKDNPNFDSQALIKLLALEIPRELKEEEDQIKGKKIVGGP